MIHSKYKLWTKIHSVCEAPVVRNVVCPYQPWALNFCCQRTTKFDSLQVIDPAIQLLTVECFLLGALFFVLFTRGKESKPIFNNWEKLMMEVRQINTVPVQKNVTWGPGLLAEETLVHRLRFLGGQRGVILKNVGKRIGSVDVIKSITCWIQPGQLVAVIGPRGLFPCPLFPPHTTGITIGNSIRDLLKS